MALSASSIPQGLLRSAWRARFKCSRIAECLPGLHLAATLGECVGECVGTVAVQRGLAPVERVYAVGEGQGQGLLGVVPRGQDSTVERVVDFKRRGYLARPIRFHPNLA